MLADALEHLVRGVVDNPDDVTVRDKQLRRGSILEVRVHPDDLGKVIGRGGRTASAFRTVISALAGRDGAMLATGSSGASGLRHGIDKAWSAVLAATSQAFAAIGIDTVPMPACAIGLGMAGVHNKEWAAAFRAADPGFGALVLDTDANAATGEALYGVGAELVWLFGGRTGRTVFAGQTSAIGQGALGLVTAPTVTSATFEVALPRGARAANGAALFGGPAVRVGLAFGPGGDRIDAAGGAASTSVEGATVGEALEALYAEHGELRGRLADDGGGLRRFVNVFVGGEDIRFLDGLETPLGEGAEVTILPAVAGG